MNISGAGIDLIKSCEGFSKKLYNDVGKPAIGYGCDLTEEEAQAWAGKEITEAEATAKLVEHIQKNVEPYINSLVKLPLKQSQFDALCSFIYNVGAGNFKASTMLKKLNKGDYAGAGEQFALWNKAGGKVNDGLTARRAKEKSLFLS